MSGLVKDTFVQGPPDIGTGKKIRNVSVDVGQDDGSGVSTVLQQVVNLAHKNGDLVDMKVFDRIEEMLRMQVFATLLLLNRVDRDIKLSMEDLASMAAKDV